MSEKMSLVFYQEMKQKWGRESISISAPERLKGDGKKEHAPYAGATKMLSIHC
jgi:hypothetical protein